MNWTTKYSTALLLLIVCGLIFILMSVTSQGFYHWDEHYQLLEFANYKSGLAEAQGLAWEFNAQIRPGLQPWIAYSIMSLCRGIGMQNPFYIALVLRLLSAMMSLVMIALYSKLILKEFPASRLSKVIFICFAGLLWFTAFLFVRFSSENWSSLFFFTGVYLLINYHANNNSKIFFAVFMSGLLLGLSFQFRYQIAFAGMGLAAWLVYNKSLNIKGWSFLVAGALLSLCIGLLCDYWLYGSLQLTALNYFNVNLIGGKAASFGVSPWYDYIPLIFNGLGPVINILFLSLCVYGLIIHRKHYMVWIVIPFLLAHTMISHKELRFMFPMLIPFLYLTTLGALKINSQIKLKLPLKILAGVVGLFNLCLLTIRTMSPADPHMPYYRYVYDLSLQPKPVVIFYTQYNMYGPSALRMTFYRPSSLIQVPVEIPEQIDNYDTVFKNAYIFSDRKSELIKPERKSLRVAFMTDYWSLKQIWTTKKLLKASTDWSLLKID